MVYKFFDKKTSGGAVKTSYEIMTNQELDEELHKPIIRKSEKRKVHVFFMDNISGADLIDLQLLSEFNTGIICY